MISDKDKSFLEAAAASFGRPLSQNELNFIARELLQSLIIRPFSETLLAVAELVNASLDKQTYPKLTLAK
jgi:hypothetical protein